MRKQAIRTMKKQRTIVVVDDNKGVLSAVKILLKNTFDKIVALPSPVALPSTLREERPDVVYSFKEAGDLLGDVITMGVWIFI